MENKITIELNSTSRDGLLNMLLLAELLPKLSLEQQCQIISEIKDLLSKR